MPILIISDIHANLTALEAVLEEAGQADAVWCLGDLVGYGPDPNECVTMVRELPNLACIIGNHDAATLNQIDSSSFNPEAREALRWTQDALSDSSVAFLRSLPERVKIDSVTLVHGSPRHPCGNTCWTRRTPQRILNTLILHTVLSGIPTCPASITWVITTAPPAC
jgi:predicted phosphodiesterase